MKTKFCISSIVGRPNAGKSTMMNHILGQKLSIVTSKVQTTRTLIRGIYTEGDLQAVFIDTPGIFLPTRALERSMVKTAWSGLEEGMDFCLHLFDCTKGITSQDREIIKVLRERKVTTLAVINKIDKIKKEKLLPMAKEIFDTGIYKEVFLTSSINGDGISDILKYLEDNSLVSPWMYDKDEVTTIPSKFLASEITREKLFLALDQELPYNLSVETEGWEETEDSVKINQVIYVTKDNYKKIIIGKRGQQIKDIGSRSRKELIEIFEKKVHLFIFVKVRENWMDNPHIYQYMGMHQP